MVDLTWKMHRYTWVADPLPPESREPGVHAGVHAVDAVLSRHDEVGFFAEELAGTCGLSLGTVATRLEELLLEGKVKVEEMEYGSEALGSQILREHFTEALRVLRRGEFHLGTMYEAHLDMHHGGDVADALDEVNGDWTCDVCRDYHAYTDEAVRLRNILLEGETEAAAHFVDAVHKLK